MYKCETTILFDDTRIGAVDIAKVWCAAHIAVVQLQRSVVYTVDMSEPSSSNYSWFSANVACAVLKIKGNVIKRKILYWSWYLTEEGGIRPSPNDNCIT